MHQPKPELVKELREAVADCDEELEKLKARTCARALFTVRAADLAWPAAAAQANKERLENQAEEIEKNIKELLKTNEALARQIMAQ